MQLKDSFTSIKGALRFRANTPYDYDRFIIAMLRLGTTNTTDDRLMAYIEYC
ncbi:hypothetical protein HUN01_05135 [Nostoc edaphicum CCNP1411]|uniref:Uncharacterized protein n=1 Tax=Nostoc edaphicum CCNP1411 TaxID=1472755 RepID=A0A7D7LAM2_9NOSO|nr:hypothetical protein [Nostoc edaphicum]QMS86990.1 hypothetical protein HUN01_05135 [Nostoc edaphicum CCNP1411]